MWSYKGEIYQNNEEKMGFEFLSNYVVKFYERNNIIID